MHHFRLSDKCIRKMSSSELDLGLAIQLQEQFEEELRQQRKYIDKSRGKKMCQLPILKDCLFTVTTLYIKTEMFNWLYWVTLGSNLSLIIL